MSRSREDGFALATALLVTFLVALALSLVSLSLLIRMRAVRQESQGVVLTALSDAALAEAVASLAVDAGAYGAPEHEFGGGRIGSRITPLSGTLFRIVATARLGQRRRLVEAYVQRTPAATQVTQWRVLPPASGP
ncbi:MAG TPA: hypothetical protein VMM92_12525 [Thermoanaerobaculia bacterium]|nr:hypothetical protein [Thermoanaerobaculia bacterium]